MKSFSEFYTEQSLEYTFQEVARELILHGWTKQGFIQHVLDHYCTADQDKFIKLVTLVENSTGSNWGSNIGSNIGGFVGGGLKGLAQGFKQAFGGGQQGAAQGQAQQGQQVYNAEAVPLNPQQIEAITDLKQAIGSVYQKLQQVGLKGYTNYLNNLFTAIKRDSASNIDNMKRAANLV